MDTRGRRRVCGWCLLLLAVAAIATAAVYAADPATIMAGISAIPPQFLVYLILAVASLLVYHIREDAARRREMYEKLDKTNALLNRIAGKLDGGTPP